MNQFEKIDFLISEYRIGNYRTADFCDQFEQAFFNEKDGSISDELWNSIVGFAQVFSRFSPYEEDMKSGGLFDEKRIKLEFKQLLEIWR